VKSFTRRCSSVNSQSKGGPASKTLSDFVCWRLKWGWGFRVSTELHHSNAGVIITHSRIRNQPTYLNWDVRGTEPLFDIMPVSMSGKYGPLSHLLQATLS